jgi:hypothetical protein
LAPTVLAFASIGGFHPSFHVGRDLVELPYRIAQFLKRYSVELFVCAVVSRSLIDGFSLWRFGLELRRPLGPRSAVTKKEREASQVFSPPRYSPFGESD